MRGGGTKATTYWISPAYADSYSQSFRIFIIAYLLLSAARPAQQTLVGIGRVRFVALAYFGASAMTLLSVWVWSSQWGLTGAAAANLWMGLLFSY